MVNSKFESTEDMIFQWPILEGKTNMKFYQNYINYYDELNYRRQSG